MGSKWHDAKRRQEQPWRRLYGTARWQNLRARYLAAHPLCAYCERDGHLTPATVLDHTDPELKKQPGKFFDGPFLGLCAEHHNRDKAREERGRPIQQIGSDGWPTS